MILSLADDLSGAAEAGGIALRFGLRAEVQTDFFPAHEVDLIVADTDSRQHSPQEAARRVERALAQYRAMPVERIFKKVDSVLRGNVMAEAGTLLATGEFDRLLLVPANPGLGRTVSQGRYWVDGQPLDRTDFANDPEYPAATSNVRQLLLERDGLGVSQRWPVTVVSPADKLPASGIVVGESSSHDDLLAWARRLDSHTIPVGAAEFLDACLQAMGMNRVDTAVHYTQPIGDTPALFVCGSTSDAAREFCRESKATGIPVVRIPLGLLQRNRPASELMQEWAASVLLAVADHSRVIIAIDQPLQHDPEIPQLLTDRLGAVVERVLKEHPVQHLLVEGGATAAALVRRMGWSRLSVIEELAPGVVTTRVTNQPDLVLTMKPGSYHWPDEVLRD